MNSSGSPAHPPMAARGPTHKALLAAVERVCRTDGTPTITAVAREVGVTPALIHNRYPDVADAIRTLAGKIKRDEVTAAKEALEEERVRNRRLREENADLLAHARALASVNESLRRQLTIEQAKAARKVVTLHPRSQDR